MVLEATQNSLYLADCIDLLKEWFKNGKREFIDLVYIDPPFNSNRNYNMIFGSEFDLSEEAFRDTWSSVSYLDELDDINAISPDLFSFLNMLETTGLPKSYISYLVKMGVRCWFIRQMLKDTGSFYYHCDPTMSHYIKTMLDFIFGLSNYRNEITWPRTSNTGSWKSKSKYFGKNYDIIFYYTKTGSYKFNTDELIVPYTSDYILSKFNHDDNDGKGPWGWNTLSHINQYEELKEKKEAEWLSGAKFPRYKQYLKRSLQGTFCSDLWNDIKPLGPRDKSRDGYETQKPEKLLERIIKTSSDKGDFVADFFIGGGTTIAVAEKLNRKWLGIDINLRAIQITQNRLLKLKKTAKNDYVIEGIPRSSKVLREMVDQNILGKEKNSKFALEDIIVKYYLDDVVGNDNKIGDHSIDGRFFFKYKGKERTGLVQVTTGVGIGHLKSFCSEVGKGTGDIGVYITFEDKVTNGMIREAKTYGKLGIVDRIQILTIEDLVDKKKQPNKPEDLLTI